jgi:hypothetical protein
MIARERMPDVKMKEADPSKIQVLDPRWLEPARLMKATVLISVLILGTLLFALLNPDSMPHNQEAFGGLAAKLGLPLWAVVTLLVCVAYLPLSFAFYHLFRLVFRGASEGGGISLLSLLRAVFVVPSRHPDLRASKWIVILILGGYLAAILTWAYFADERDLERKRNESQIQQGAKEAVDGR